MNEILSQIRTFGLNPFWVKRVFWHVFVDALSLCAQSFTHVHVCVCARVSMCVCQSANSTNTRVAGLTARTERWGAGVETQKNVRGEIGGWGRVPFNETYAPSLSTIYDGT